jgi:hypothetical protein
MPSFFAYFFYASSAMVPLLAVVAVVWLRP